ncbi:MAG: hypothetical protein ACYCQI_00170 [Gammaproteobacteria bacterium]
MRNGFLAGLFIILWAVVKVVYAEKSFTCTPLTLKTHEQEIILPGVSDPHATQIYFLKNIAQQSIWLDHPDERHRGAHAGWSSYLRTGKWSALLLNRKNFTLSCAEIQPGKVQYHNCEKSITVCTPQHVQFDSKRKGSYWLVEDQTWDELLKSLEKRGAKLK